MSPHAFGIAGELLNLFGGLILAGDIIFRQQQRAQGNRVSDLSEFARAISSTGTYRGFPAASRDLRERVLDQRVTLYGWIGVGILLLGFVLSALYHYLEIISH